MRGFTLIESIMVAAIAASMCIALGLLTFNFTTLSNYESALSQSSGSATTLMREVEALIAPADMIVSSRTFSGTLYTSDANALILEIPSIDGTGNVIANTYDYAVIYRTGATVYRILEADPLSVRGGGTKQLSSTVSALSFAYNNTTISLASVVTVDLQTQTTVKQQTLSDHRHEQLRLRNY